jgi:hypothetical protein
MIKKIRNIAIVLVVGCALIWFVLPLLRKVSPGTYYGIAANVTGRDFVVPDTEPVQIAHPFWRGAKIKDLAQSVADAASDAVSGKDGEGGVAGLAKRARRGAAAAASNVAAAARDAVGDSAPEEPVDEGPDPRAATNADPGYGWGVLVRNADFFDPKMKKLGTLPGGTVVEHMTVVQKPEGEVVSCRVLRNLEWQPRAVVFFTADLVRFDGVTYADAPRRERDAVMDYCTASAKLDALRAAQQPKRAKNPFEEEYRAAKAKHDAFQKHVNEVNSKIRWANTHDLPGGPTERARLLQEGRELRGKQVAEDAAFKPIRDKWTDWEKKHPQQNWRPVKETPEMKELQQIIDKLRPAVVQICPGL